MSVPTALCRNAHVGPVGTASPSECGVCAGEGIPGAETGQCQGFLPPWGPGFSEAKNHLSCLNVEAVLMGGSPNGCRPNGMQAWAQPLQVMLPCCLVLVPKAHPTLTTNAAMPLSSTQFINPGMLTVTCSWIWPKSWPVTPKPSTWPYLDLNPDSYGPHICQPPCGHTGSLALTRASWCLAAGGLSLIT